MSNPKGQALLDAGLHASKSNLRPRQKKAPRDMDLSGMTDIALAEHVAVLDEAVTLADRKAMSAIRKHQSAIHALACAESELQRRDRQARGVNTTAASRAHDTSSHPPTTIHDPNRRNPQVLR